MKSDFLIALTQLAAERHLPKEQVLQAIEVALASAFKKDNPASGQNITVKLNPNTGDVRVFALKTVVEEIEDPTREIGLKEALVIRKDVTVGDEIASPEPLPHSASRIAAQTAKQVVLQRLREAEREKLYEEFLQHQDDIVSGVIEQIESGRNVVLDLGRVQAIMPSDEQVYTERYRKGQRLKVYVLNVHNASKGPEIVVSRSHKNLLKRLFEIEVPEVYNGVVEIKAIAREPGLRSKVAVYSTQEGIDPVGSCIGIRGNRIQSIVNELQGEKIDVVPWDKDTKAFIAKALSPSEVVHVELSSDEQTAMVVVPDRQLSLAIGKEGQNARLAARLAGWRLDIKGMAEWEKIKETKQRQLEEERRLAAQRVAEDKAAQKAAAVALAEPEDEVKTEAMAVAEVEVETQAMAAVEAEAVAEKLVEPEPEPALVEATAQVVTTPEDELNEEALLEALIREEEATQKAETKEELATGISVEELASFTLDDVVEAEDFEDEYEGEERNGDLFPEVSVLTPDAGKIRFAEDIVGEQRGEGRRGRRSSRAPSRGGNRGNRRGGR